jgi:hypothetical protein
VAMNDSENQGNVSTVPIDRRVRRWGCNSCDWLGLETYLLRAPNPFDQGETEILGCPKCKAVDDFLECCDEAGCEQEASCGFPTESGYRRTCWKHYRLHNSEPPNVGVDRHAAAMRREACWRAYAPRRIAAACPCRTTC